jgi:hypothetical protein
MVSQAAETEIDLIRKVHLQCEQVSSKVNKILDRCRPKEKSFWESVKAFLRIFASKPVTEQLQSELGFCAKNSHLAVSEAALYVSISAGTLSRGLTGIIDFRFH